LNALKSTSRWQGRQGDRASERSLSAKLRAYGQKLYQAEPQGRPREALWVQHDEARPGHCGMVNTEVVQRKIVFLPGEIYLPKLSNDGGGTEPAKVRVNRVGVSRRRELRDHSEERSEGSVTGSETGPGVLSAGLYPPDRY
jgi:hypothetical protein